MFLRSPLAHSSSSSSSYGLLLPLLVRLPLPMMLLLPVTIRVHGCSLQFFFIRFSHRYDSSSLKINGCPKQFPTLQQVSMNITLKDRVASYECICEGMNYETECVHYFRHSQLFTSTSQLVVLDQVIAGRKMESCKIAILLTIYIMAMLVFAHCCVAENVAEDVAAIPPAPMESAGVHLCASAVFLATAFVVARFT
ncbi:hypothetical protein HKD37_05G013434 [Glycine soja]